MPLTPLHLVIGWAVFLTGRRRWSFVGLSMGSVIPDIEVPVLWGIGWETVTGHGAFHSTIGAATLGVLAALLGVYLVLPTLIGWWENRFGNRWVHFAGVDVTNLGTMPKVAVGAFVGVMLHISLDFLTHTMMPYFWPWAPDTFTFAMAGELWWHVVVNAALLAALVAMLIRCYGRVERAASHGKVAG